VIKAEFLASLPKSSLSHDPSEIILICLFAAQETFLIIFYVENRSAVSYFCGNHERLEFLIKHSMNSICFKYNYFMTYL